MGNCTASLLVSSRCKVQDSTQLQVVSTASVTVAAARTTPKNRRNGMLSSSSWWERVTLTESQKRLVAETMYHVRSRLTDVGIRVFRTIFTIRPQLRELFAFRDTKDEDLDLDEAFRTHAARFMAVVGCAIQSLQDHDDDDSDQVEDLCYRVGAQHLHVPGFQQDTFNIFKDALLACIAEQLGGKDKFKGELYKAWDAVVRYIFQRLHQGYMDAHINDIHDQDPNPSPEPREEPSYPVVFVEDWDPISGDAGHEDVFVEELTDTNRFQGDRQEGKSRPKMATLHPNMAYVSFAVGSGQR